VKDEVYVLQLWFLQTLPPLHPLLHIMGLAGYCGSAGSLDVHAMNLNDSRKTACWNKRC